jgi:hypothetical protein
VPEAVGVALAAVIKPEPAEAAGVALAPALPEAPVNKFAPSTMVAVLKEIWSPLRTAVWGEASSMLPPVMATVHVISLAWVLWSHAKCMETES